MKDTEEMLLGASLDELIKMKIEREFIICSCNSSC